MRWGLACSALFHLAIVGLALLVVPEPRKPRALPKEVPVEIVRKLPEKKPAAKPKAQKPIKKTARKTASPKPKSKKPDAETKKVPPKLPLVAEKKQEPAPKPAPKPDVKKVEPKPLAPEQNAEAPQPKPAPKPAPEPAQKKAGVKEPVKEPQRLPKEPPQPQPPRLPLDLPPPTTAKEPQLALGPKPPVLRPKPPAPPKPEASRITIAPRLGGVPSPDAKRRKFVSQWVLVPLTLNVGGRCGRQQVTGTLYLVSQRVLAGGAEIQYRAEMRTVHRSERCAPQGRLRYLYVIKRGDRVSLLDEQGVLDKGFMSKDVILIKDDYGSAMWRRRR